MVNGGIHMKIRAVLRLFDTARGITLKDSAVTAYGEQGGYRLLTRPGGRYCIMDTGMEEALVRITVQNYEESTVLLPALVLGEGPPELQVHLIPRGRQKGILTVRGILPGIRELTAIPVSEEGFRIGSYEGESRILTLLRPIRDAPEQKGYGLIGGQEEFEPVILEEAEGPGSFRLQEIPRRPPVPGEVIKRLIYGSTDGAGRYLIRFCRTTGREAYLIRYVTRKGSFFRGLTAAEGDPEERSL